MKRFATPQRSAMGAASTSGSLITSRAMRICRAQQQPAHATVPRAAATAATSTRPPTTTPAAPGVQPLRLLACTAAAALLLLGAPAAAPAAAPSTTAAGANVGFLSDAEVDERRAAAHVRRSHDGHVALQDKRTKEWMDVKCDLQAPGALLFRGPTGQVYYISYANLSQIDLSDDDVVAAISEQEWEGQITPIEGKDDQGVLQKLELTREGFFQLVSVLQPQEEMEAAAAAMQ